MQLQDFVINDIKPLNLTDEISDLKLLFIAPERIENIDFMEKVQDPSFSNIIKLKKYLRAAVRT